MRTNYRMIVAMALILIIAVVGIFIFVSPDETKGLDTEKVQLFIIDTSNFNIKPSINMEEERIDSFQSSQDYFKHQKAMLERQGINKNFDFTPESVFGEHDLVNWKTYKADIKNVEKNNDIYTVTYDITILAEVYNNKPGDESVKGTYKMIGEFEEKNLELKVKVDGDKYTYEMEKPTMDRLGYFSLLWNREHKFSPTFKSLTGE